MMPTHADRPTVGGKQYHIALGDGDLAPTVLLPGDPGRVAELAEVWGRAEEMGTHREYHSMRGEYRGVPISACSTGIGGPSTEIAVNELAEIGCNTFIRLGTTGALQEYMHVGDVVISTASIRWDGASDSYAPPAYPASASYEVTLALIEACERLELRYHVGVSATVASFYAAQARPAFDGYAGQDGDRVAQLRAMGVVNFEMEAATIFTLCSLYGLRAGAVCVAIADRHRGHFNPEGAGGVLACVGAEATRALAQMDAIKDAAGKRWYYPGLSGL